MITTNLTGNLGNHMWQYSVCRSLAEYKGYEWGINPSPTHDYHSGMNQMYFMNVDFGKQISGIQKEIHENWTFTKFDSENVNTTKTDYTLLNIEDNTKIFGKDGALGALLQSEKYFELCGTKVENWFTLKNEFVSLYEEKLKSMSIVLDENLCIINFRGGEYRSIPKIVCNKNYWNDSINIMKSLNPNIKFLIVSDDISFAQSYMPFHIDGIHVDIGFDFYVVNQSKWSIISNSSFGWWASWLNQKSNKILAPKYWSAHNFSNGFWGLGEVFSKKFDYVDRDGKLQSYSDIISEID